MCGRLTEWTAPGLLLIGDAAHPMSPVGGQGVNIALRDASHYPDSARGMRLSGRVYIVVHYRDGKAWGPRIVQSSGFPALDQAVRAQFGDGARYQYRLRPPVLRALGLTTRLTLVANGKPEDECVFGASHAAGNSNRDRIVTTGKLAETYDRLLRTDNPLRPIRPLAACTP